MFTANCNPFGWAYNFHRLRLLGSILKAFGRPQGPLLESCWGISGGLWSVVGGLGRGMLRFVVANTFFNNFDMILERIVDAKMLSKRDPGIKNKLLIVWP